MAAANRDRDAAFAAKKIASKNDSRKALVGSGFDRLPDFSRMGAEEHARWTRSALLLQHMWLDGKRYWTTGVVKAISAKAKQHSVIRSRVHDVVVYALFLTLYTVDLVSQKGDQNVFHFPDQVKEQFTGVEFKGEQVLKTFDDVHTIKEIWQWFEGPFLDAAYSESTFDGRTKQPGMILGHGHKLGGLRVGQVRMTNRDCAANMPAYLGKPTAGHTPVECFGDDSGAYARWAEDTADFGKPRFTWKGWNGTDTAEERSRPLTYALSLNLNGRLPSAAYSVVLPNHGYARAAELLRKLRDANYVDLATRSVAVDLTVWNVMMRRLVVIRMMFLLPQGGGVIPDFKMISVPDWPFPQTAGAYFLTVAIALFFTYFAYGTLRKIWFDGWGAIGGFIGVVHNLNILLYWVAWGLRFGAHHYLPAASAGILHGDAFVSMRSYAELLRMATIVKACNSFLCWFKIVTHLSLEPKFSLVTTTLSRSAAHISAFIFIFVILGYAFASCFQLTFGDSMASYRSLTEVNYSMLRGLLGDFDLNAMQEAHWLMGPFLFLGFVSVAVFVILNLIIAIISDSYMEAQESLEGQEEVKLGHEIKAYARTAWGHVKERAWKVPGLGNICRRVAKVVPDAQIKATLQRVTEKVAQAPKDAQVRRASNHLGKITLDKANFSNSFRASSRGLRIGSVDEGAGPLTRRGSLEGVPENGRPPSVGPAAEAETHTEQLKKLFSVIEILRADVAKVREFQDKNALSSKHVAQLNWLADKARTAAAVGDSTGDAPGLASEDPVHV